MIETRKLSLRKYADYFCSCEIPISTKFGSAFYNLVNPLLNHYVEKNFLNK